MINTGSNEEESKQQQTIATTTTYETATNPQMTTTYETANSQPTETAQANNIVVKDNDSQEDD